MSKREERSSSTDKEDNDGSDKGKIKKLQEEPPEPILVTTEE